MPHVHDADPTAPRSADIIDLDRARRRALGAAAGDPEPGGTLERARALRSAGAALSAHAAALGRCATSLLGCTETLERLNRRLAAEGGRARAIVADAERVTAAIEAGDLAAMQDLQQELTRLMAQRPASAAANDAPAAAAGYASARTSARN